MKRVTLLIKDPRSSIDDTALLLYIQYWREREKKICWIAAKKIPSRAQNTSSQAEVAYVCTRRDVRQRRNII